MAKSKQQQMQEQFSAMFAGMDPIEDQTAEPAAEQPKKKRGRPKNTELKPQKKSEHKSPFSVWLDQKTAADLKMYSAISGEKTTDIVERALTEYMNRHKLTEDQKTAYKQKMMKNLNDI